MLELWTAEQLLALGRALGSPVRIEILQLVQEGEGANLNELAARLHVTGSAMTAHIRALEEAGLLRVSATPGRRGTQKRCYLRESRVAIDLARAHERATSYETEIPIGSYTAWQARPTCGLATCGGLIGALDDPRYFDDPARVYAGILWLTEGFVEYRLPNYLQPGQRLVELQLIQELSSEAPGFCENWPSELHFSLNGLDLGFWLSPSDFGQKRGLYTPEWWHYGLNQYGMLKPLVLTPEGCFIDGTAIGPYRLGDLNIGPGTELRYRISAPASKKGGGGLTLFGSGFGNYGQNIRMRMRFEVEA